ncbi:MAG: RNA-binding protein [Methanobacteriota archaeon]
MSIRIKNRHRLKTKEINEIIQELTATYHHTFFERTASIETGDLEGFTVIFIENDVDFFRNEQRILLTLRGVLKYKLTQQKIVVDMGAVKFIVNGADIMAAGIVDADPEIKVDDPVWVCDETYQKPLAVGIALLSGQDMTTTKTGKAVKNLHYVGDPLWTLTKIP